MKNNKLTQLVALATLSLAGATIANAATNYQLRIPVTNLTVTAPPEGGTSGTPVVKPPVVNTPVVSLGALALPDATVGEAYSADLTSALSITGVPEYNTLGVAWSVTAGGSLPAGLALSAEGVLSGTPNSAADTSLPITVTYQSVTGTQTYSLKIKLNIQVALVAGTIPDGMVGVGYGVNLNSLLSVTGDPNYVAGSGVTWDVSAGALPAGLALNSSTGIITGTPTTGGPASFTVRATYKTKSGVQTYSMQVSLNIAVALSAGTLPDGMVGVAYGVNLNSLLSVTGDPSYVAGSGVTWAVSAGTLPAGLSLNASTGIITGTPTTGGPASFTVRATYKTKSGVQTYSMQVSLNIAVALSAGTIPDGMVGVGYGVNLNSLLSVTGDPNYVAGTGVTWDISTGTLPDGLSLNASTGIITGTPTTGGPASFTVRATYKTKSGVQTYSMQVSLNIAVALSAGTIPDGMVGVAYTGADLNSLLSVTGDPSYVAGTGVTWDISTGALPAGLSLNASTGIITGTPTTGGPASFTVRATYKTNSGVQTYSMQVSLNISVALAARTLPDGMVGVTYAGVSLNSFLSVTGDPNYVAGTGVTWDVSSGVLPAGLSLDSSTGVITGTPTTGGTGNFTVRATYKTKTGVQAYSIQVSLNIVVTLAPTTLSDGLVGVSYALGGLKPYLTITGDPAYVAGSGTSVTWSISSGALPAGLTLSSSTGVISGKPTTAGASSFVVRATYKTKTGEQTYSMQVNLNIVVTLSSYTFPNGKVGTPYSSSYIRLLTGVTGDPSYVSGTGVTWDITAGALPAGLALSGSTGDITGNPTAGGTSTFTVRATYKTKSASTPYSIVVDLNIKVAFNSVEPPKLVTGSAYSYNLNNLVVVTGDPNYDVNAVTWTAQNLPAGLYLSGSTVQGTPTDNISYWVQLYATYKGVTNNVGRYFQH
jgi:hypothetical protein